MKSTYFDIYMSKFGKLKKVKDYLIKTYLEKLAASSCCALSLNYQLSLFSCAYDSISFCNI